MVDAIRAVKRHSVDRVAYPLLTSTARPCVRVKKYTARGLHVLTLGPDELLDYTELAVILNADLADAAAACFVPLLRSSSHTAEVQTRRTPEDEVGPPL